MTADYDATEKLNLFGNAIYNVTEGGMNSFSLQWPAGVDLTDPVLVPLYDLTNMTGVETYSDLKYQQVSVGFGGSYAFSPALYLSAQASYDMFLDDQEYVYGDQDGDAYRVSLGLGYRF